MKKTCFIMLPCLWCLIFSPIYGQEIINEEEIETDASILEQVGYPLKIVPGEKGKFLYLEYFNQGEKEGDSKRLSENYYLQSVSSRSYREHWFAPVTEPGTMTMSILDLIRLKDGCFVVGQQVLDGKKRSETVARFFDLEGVAKTERPVILSQYEPKLKRKRFKDMFTTSPGREVFLWMGTDQNRFFTSAWSGKGDSLWSKELQVDLPPSTYKLQEFHVDDSANVLLLFTNKVPTYTSKDLETPPILIRYNSKLDAYDRLNVSVENGVVLHATMKVDPNNDLLLMGASFAMSAARYLQNGARIKGTRSLIQNWSHIYMKKIDHKEFAVSKEVQVEIPEKFVKEFGTAGSNFSKFQIITDRGHAILITEEHFFNKEKQYFLGIAGFGFNIETGNLSWSDIVKKRQITKLSAHHMSYVPAISRGRLRLVYLSEIGARGEVTCTSIELSTGKRRDKKLASNEEGNYLFFPKRSGLVSAVDMVLLGLGNPYRASYKLMTISF